MPSVLLRSAGSTIAALVVHALCSIAVAAQETAPTVAAASPTEVPVRRNVISLQPLQATAGVFSVDYERAVRGGFTLGVGSSYWNDRTLNFIRGFRAQYLSGELKGRFYPGGRAFHGLSIAVTAGASRVAYDDLLDFDTTSRTVVAHGLKVGTELDYNWIVGRQQRLTVAVGLGVLVFLDRFQNRPLQGK